MLLNLTQLVIALLFLQLMYCLISTQNILELFIVMLAVITITIGEAFNLMVYKMAVYNGFPGIPWYIIIGGAIVCWGIYKLTINISRRYNIECIFCRLFIVIGLSLFLPIIEVLGLKTDLWYWTRNYSILSLAWYLGVWKFYLTFVTSPAILGVVTNMFASDSSCSCKIKNPKTSEL